MSDETICIIGGGTSVRQVDLAALSGTIIGVNDSAIHAPRCDIVVSMDRLWTEYRWPNLCALRRPAWLRRSAVQNIVRWPSQPWLHVFECDHESVEFSERVDALNGTNSGLCAFNLAYVMRPKRIYLLGFDMARNKNGEAYWYPPYPWTTAAGATSGGKYAAWSRQFDAAAAKCRAAGIAVFNCSLHSAIDAFPKLDPRQLARELAA